MNPTLSELAPPVWNYFLKSREEFKSDVKLVSGLSGAGYAYPQLMDNSQLNAYLERTKTYLAETGLRSVRVAERKSLWNQDLASSYYQHLRGAPEIDPVSRVLYSKGLLGAIVGLDGSPWGLGFEFAGVPMPAVRPSYTINSTNMDELIRDIMVASKLQLTEPGTILVDLGASYEWHFGKAADDGESLFFEHNRTGTCCFAVKGPFATLAPGTYSAKFRLKVTDNSSSDVLGSLFIFEENGSGSFIENSLGLTELEIRPDQFSAANAYQDFEVIFTLTEFVNNVEFRINHKGGAGDFVNTTDMFADRIKVTRQGGLDLPLFAPVLLGLIAPADRPFDRPLNDLPRAFLREIEHSGGLVLSPDEFLAALNPEYMLAWAETMLPPSELQIARLLLSRDDYLGSLISIREALSELPMRTFEIASGVPAPIEIQADTHITHSSYDSSQRVIAFRAHDPPDGNVTMTINIPKSLFGPLIPADIELDSQTYSLNPIDSGNFARLELNSFEQGPHQIAISLP